MSAAHGRRGLPPESETDDLAPLSAPSAARRGAVVESDSAASTSSGRARRGLPVEEPRGGDEPSRSAWLAIAGLGVALALLIGVLYIVVGGRDSSAEPSPTTSPTGTLSASPAPSGSPSSSASPSMSGSPTAPTSPSPSPSPSASPTPTVDPALLTLNGMELRIPEGWELYADETIQDNRRLVRLMDPATDVRVQAVTLPEVAPELDEACMDLMADHRGLYDDVAESLAVDVPVTGAGAGVACSFTGTRASDGQPGKVEFTVLRRESDGHSLIFRDTIPGGIADDAPARQQLFTAECAAATSFGLTVDQCVATPGQADG